jgi:hypothetical protein
MPDEHAPGWQAGLEAEYVTDPDTMGRVLAGLRGQLAGVDPLGRYECLELPLATMEARRHTPLGQLYYERRSR